jgi:hypothetical protein
LGEEQVDAFLAASAEQGLILSHEWVSEEDATSPFDFRLQTKDGVRLVDVKSTAYGFGRPVHVSLGELREMTEAAEPADLYRVHELTEDESWLCVARDVRAFAGATLAAFSGLPDGVSVDSVSVNPLCLTWEPRVHLSGVAD